MKTGAVGTKPSQPATLNARRSQRRMASKRLKRAPRHRSFPSISKKKLDPVDRRTQRRAPRECHSPPALRRESHNISYWVSASGFIAALTTFVVGWVSLNWFAVALGYRALDPPPFAWLAGASSLTSLYLVILILTTQSGDDRLTQRRELLNLELTILS